MRYKMQRSAANLLPDLLKLGHLVALQEPPQLKEKNCWPFKTISHKP